MSHIPKHISVLRNEVLNELVTSETKSVFDGTLGLGGHAEFILTTYPNIESYIATDLDAQHLEIATKTLSKFSEKTTLYHESFSEIDALITQTTPRPLSILLDLGLCSNHVDDPEKGFSFVQEGPLKMSFDGSDKAEIFLNTASKEDIQMVFREYGELKNAPKLARGIVGHRQKKLFTTTTDLKTVLEKHTHPKDQKKTLTLAFQAIRIHVNDEIEVLKDTLEKALNLMKPNDKLGIISYHSLEDRIVKKRFSVAAKPLTQSDNFSLHSVVKEAEFFLPIKKPLVPSPEEISANPRARSAKLRILQKK